MSRCPPALLLSGALLLPVIVHAEATPHGAGFDARVRRVAYNAMDVVRLVGSPTSSTQVIFQAGEEVTNVAIGDADAWLAQPVGNLLFLKPTVVRAATNMQVVTRRADGANRSYQFSLVAVARSQAGPNRPLYAVSFTYPDDDARGRVGDAARKADADAQQVTTAQMTGAWAQGPRNWRYVAQGSTTIEPTEVSDNGRQTAFRFPGNMRLPTIYTAAPDGTDTIVPYTVVDERVVVQTTARQFTLRDGQEVLRIVNRGFDPVGRDAGTGTGLPTVKRVVKAPAP